MVHHIIGQQISTKAQQTIWLRLNEKYGHVTPEVIDSADAAELQSLGMTFRKAEYIKDFSHKVVSGEFSLEAVWHMSDKEAVEALSSLKGVGVWTAEMILLFCMQRPDILSFGDLAISVECAWCIITEKSTKSSLKNTAGGCPITAALQACISGRYRAALLRE